MKTKSQMLTSALAPVAVAGFVLASVSVGNAVTYVQTSDDCTGHCGTSSSNTVTVAADGTTVIGGTTMNVIDISVSLAPGFNFIHSGFPGSFGFGLSSGFSSIDFLTGTTPWSTNTWTPINSPVSATSPQSVNGASQSWDGSGTFTNGYGMTWNGGNGIGNEDGTTLDFHIAGVGLTLANFAADTTGSFFAADVAGVNTNSDGVRNTGIIDFTLAPTPVPGALVLFGTVFGAGYFGLRRRRQGASASVPA
jgi:hypothetical protein